MRICYPYNEILPKKSAHDVYIFQECAAFAASGIETTLCVGRGSLDLKQLSYHYLHEKDASLKLILKQLPIIRKNNWLNISCNRLFFHYAQREIIKNKPQVVFLSVFKQGLYHLNRKVPHVKYVYEVHELSYYPGSIFSKKAQIEKEMLSSADLITVTTEELKKILLSKPYELQVPIEVIPLAVHTRQLPERPLKDSCIQLCYVGQLYESQGITMLLQAMTQLPKMELKIIGGKPEEIITLKKLCHDLDIETHVHFTGFQPPAMIPELVADTDIFVAPFLPVGKMPYVAHTKLMEYAEWKRPMIVPDLPVSREHFTENEGVLFYTGGNVRSLIDTLKNYTQKEKLQALKILSQARTSKFNWQARIERYAQIIRY